MSASGSVESLETKIENTHEFKNTKSRYALYLFGNNKHASLSDSSNDSKEDSYSMKEETKSSDTDEPIFCLSLLEGNLGAELETIVRCYLLKSLPVHEDISFENEGKYTVLASSDETDEVFGCYYHRLSKSVEELEETEFIEEKRPIKMHTFFICLIGPNNGIMESFCPELGTFCCSLIPLLDPEGLKNQEHMQLKLKSWYYYCVEYVSRCIKKFKEDLALALHCSLWGNVEIIAPDEETVWDLERLVETCSLMPKCTDNEKDTLFVSENTSLSLEVKDGKIIVDKKIGPSQYCMRWYEKLKNCYIEDYAALHNILEGFRLKAIQDLNTLKRLVQKAETDHYALFRSYHFLQGSGYEDVLLHHVKHDANVVKEMGTIEVITCLQEFMASNSNDL